MSHAALHCERNDKGGQPRSADVKQHDSVITS